MDRDTKHLWLPADYDRVQRMIDATIEGRTMDDQLASEGYVDDRIRGLDIDDKADGTVINEVRSLEDSVNALERRLSDVESNQGEGI